ncbi:MAG: hypothetical protein Q7U57_13255 [Methylovulum sp.]|nr:hypothetical protein [Methylovulum sp.]
MQVEAIYSQGCIKFVEPLRLKHDHIRLIVNVPDDEVELQTTPFGLPAQALSRAQAMLAKYQAILNAPYPPDEDLPELNAEYQERLEAIDLRAQIRQEQGRPV